MKRWVFIGTMVYVCEVNFALPLVPLKFKKNRHFGPSHQLMQMKTYTENQKGSFVHPSNSFPENFRYPIKNVARDRLAQGYRSTNTNVVALRYRIGTGCAIRRRRLHT